MFERWSARAVPAGARGSGDGDGVTPRGLGVRGTAPTCHVCNDEDLTPVSVKEEPALRAASGDLLVVVRGEERHPEMAFAILSSWQR